MANLANRLKLLREESGLIQKELAAKLNIPRATLASWESGNRVPELGTVELLADFFKTPVDYLLGRTENREIDIVDIFQNENFKITAGGNLLTQDQRLRLLRSIDNLPPDNITSDIPILGQIHAGLPLLTEENWKSQIDVPSYLKADFALRVEGDGMIYAGILNGDIAIFQESNTAQTGQIVAAGVQDSTWEAYLKFYIEKNSQILLRSANPEYIDIEFGKKHRIIGFLVGVIRDQSPTLNDYQSLLTVKGHKDKQWVEVMEKATGYGIRPDKIKSVLEMHWEMLNKK